MRIRDRGCWISFPRVSLGGSQGKRTGSEDEDSWTPSCPDLYLGAHFLTSECWEEFISGLEKPKNRVSIRERSDKGSAPHSSTPGGEGVQCTLIRFTRPSPSGPSKFCPFSSHSLNCQSLLTDSTVPHPTLSKKGETLGRQECAPLQDRDPPPKRRGAHELEQAVVSQMGNSLCKTSWEWGERWTDHELPHPLPPQKPALGVWDAFQDNASLGVQVRPRERKLAGTSCASFFHLPAVFIQQLGRSAGCAHSVEGLIFTRWLPRRRRAGRARERPAKSCAHSW